MPKSTKQNSGFRVIPAHKSLDEQHNRKEIL